MKRCTCCGETKQFSEFHKKTRSSDRHNCYCKLCANTRTKARAKANPDRVKQHRKDKYLRTLETEYKLTETQYVDMFVTQNGKCAICGIGLDSTKAGKARVDHDHVTGKVRGLLCNNCNRGLGFFKDKPAHLRSAAKYLERV